MEPVHTAVSTLASTLSALLQHGATFQEIKEATESLRSHVAVEQNNAEQMHVIDTNFCEESLLRLRQSEKTLHHKLQNALMGVNIARTTAQRTVRATIVLTQSIAAERAARHSQHITSVLLSQLNRLGTAHVAETTKNVLRIKDVMEDVDADVAYGMRAQDNAQQPPEDAARAASLLQTQTVTATLLRSNKQKQKPPKPPPPLPPPPAAAAKVDLMNTLDATFHALRTNVSRLESTLMSSPLPTKSTDSMTPTGSTNEVISAQYNQLLIKKAAASNRLAMDETILSDVSLTPSSKNRTVQRLETLTR